MLKNKKTMYIALIVLVILLLSLTVYYFYKRNKLKNEVLTPKERVDILKELVPTNTAPVPDAQRTKILKQLVPTISKTKTTTTTAITPEKRLDILSNLSKQ